MFLSRYRGYSECPDCKGSRLRQEALNIKVHERTMADVTKLNIAEAYQFFGSPELTPEETVIAAKLLASAAAAEILERCRA